MALLLSELSTAPVGLLPVGLMYMQRGAPGSPGRHRDDSASHRRSGRMPPWSPSAWTYLAPSGFTMVGIDRYVWSSTTMRSPGSKV